MANLTEEQINQHSIGILINNGATGNCKLTTLAYLHVFAIDSITNEDKKKIFDDILRKSLQVVYLNTQYKIVAEFFKKNYILFGYNEIPIGYKAAPIQYHIFVKNNVIYSDGENYMNPPIKTIIEINAYKDNFKVNIDNPMIEIIDNRKEIKNKKLNEKATKI